MRVSTSQSTGNGHDLIRERFLAGGDPWAVLDQRAELVESVVAGAWSDYLAPAYPSGLAVVAVGGFGRRELFPHSDIDVLVLLGSSMPTGVAREALARFLQSIWDAGLRLSHSVHAVKDCCELHGQNIELNISLLDQRYLAGDTDLDQELSARLPKFVQAQRQPLARHLCRLARQRHARFHDTIYHLEPNIKEMPGGIRDLHLMAWLHQLRGQPVTDLLDRMAASRTFLAAVRCWLHFRAGRDNNLLTFDAQEEITGQPFAPCAGAAETMRAYYRHARAIHREALREVEAVEGQGSSLLAGFRDWRSRLSNAEFTVSRERLLFKAPQRLEKEPELVLRLFQMVGRHKLGLHQESERRIREYLPLLEESFRGRDLWPALRELLGLPHASLALRAMHETGVLKAIFTEWERI
jgi:[protein-PII] uridylyltransferase